MPENGLAAMVRRTKPGMYTTGEAARMIGRSTDTIKRWRVSGAVVPSEAVQAGKLTIHLYSEGDLEALRGYAQTVRPGPKGGAAA